MQVLFLDTEFTGLEKNAQLISIALYYSDDCYLYAEFNDVDYTKVSDWIKEQVVVHLEFIEHKNITLLDNRKVKLKGSIAEIKQGLQKWTAQFDEIEIWADVLAYDWVLFCDIFGGALHIPKNIFYIPFDLSTLLKIQRQNPDLNRFEFISHLLTENEKKLQHHALIDAKVSRLCYDKIT